LVGRLPASGPVITSASNETNAAEIDAMIVMNPNCHRETARVGLRARLLSMLISN
jgi:hypothetical protein